MVFWSGQSHLHKQRLLKRVLLGCLCTGTTHELWRVGKQLSMHVKVMTSPLDGRSAGEVKRKIVLSCGACWVQVGIEGGGQAIGVTAGRPAIIRWRR